MRLIDADAAYKAACEGADNWDGGCSPYRDDCIREEMDKVPTASPWHRVEDGLPEKATWVLTIAKELNVTIFNIATVDAGGQWWTTSPHKIMRELYGVRYWMPIDPPKEENE